MNFLGHSVLAAESSEDPRHWLGSMLPDFARMAGTRLKTVTDPACAAGVRHHHAVDALFHDDPRFRDWMGHVRSTLEPTDVPRPAVLGVSHVGVEILLDGVLLEHASRSGFPLAERYLEAIGALPHLLGHIQCSRGGAAAMERLGQRLQERGVPRAYRDPAQVAGILHRVLGARPRLRYADHHGPTIARALRDVRPDIQNRAEALLDALRAGLSG